MEKMKYKKKIIGIIPARMASSRFYGKPLAKIHNIPMIGHCYFRSKMSDFLDEVYIATCDQEIVAYTESIGGIPIMTSDCHKRASDRTAEALLKIEKETNARVDIVVMIQGDEPMLQPGMINEALKPLVENESIIVSNLMSPLKSTEEHDDINEVKVVVDKNDFALYFSREAIPSRRKGGEYPSDIVANNIQKQVCIIPFQRDFLITFNNLEPTPLEIIESVDMLRVLEHGYRVKMIRTDYNIYSVDTESDRQKVEKLMENDELVGKYK